MKTIVKVSLFCCVFLGCAFATSPSYDHVIVFGDSLSDCGNALPSQPSDMIADGNNTWVVVQGRVGTPITNKEKGSQARPLWNNHLVRLLKAIKEVDIYPETVAHNRGLLPTLHNVSYAWGSAETGDEYINDASQKSYFPINPSCQHPGLMKPGLSCVPGLIIQVRMYLKDLKTIGVRDDPQALYLIWAGGNDFFSNMAKALLSVQRWQHRITVWFHGKAKAEAVEPVPPMSHPVDNIVRAVSLLVQSGVQPSQIYVINLPNLARTPAAIEFTGGHRLTLWLLQTITRVMNAHLRWVLHAHLFHAPRSLNDVNLISSYDFLEKVLADPARYHYQHLQQSCFAGGGLPYCQGYLFFNGKHPTVQTGGYLARFVASAIVSGDSFVKH